MTRLPFEQPSVSPAEVQPLRRLPDNYAIPPQPYAREVDGEPLHVAMTRMIIELVDQNSETIAEACRDRAKQQMEQILLANMHAQCAVMSSIQCAGMEDRSDIHVRFDALAWQQTEFELARQLRPFDRSQPEEMDRDMQEWIQKKGHLEVIDTPRILHYLAVTNVNRGEDGDCEVDVTIVREICYFDLYSPEGGGAVIIQQDTYAAFLDESREPSRQLLAWIALQTDQTIKGGTMTLCDSSAIAALVEACEEQTLRECDIPIYPAVRSYRAALVGRRFA